MEKTPYYFPHSIFMTGKEYVRESNRGKGYNNWTHLTVEYPKDL